MRDVLANRILEIEGSGAGTDEKLRRLLAEMSDEERATLPGQWIQARAGALLWEDNLLDWATARLAR